jgi:small subunit ribosomal protein S18
MQPLKEIDWKDVALLKKFMTAQAKIASRKRTGTCAKHQRIIARAIKRARNFGLLPFTTRVINK